MNASFSVAPTGLSHFSQLTHGLRRGLYSFAASRLGALPVPRFCRPYGAFVISAAHPRLTPWAIFFRRFAAVGIATKARPRDDRRRRLRGKPLIKFPTNLEYD